MSTRTGVVGFSRDMDGVPATPFDDLEPHDVLCAKDIAERLHVDPRSVRRAIARGELRAMARLRAAGARVRRGGVVALAGGRS